jgi:hypothetical protein
LGQDVLHPVKIDGSDLQRPDKTQQDDQGGFCKVLQVFRFRRIDEIGPGCLLR